MVSFTHDCSDAALSGLAANMFADTDGAGENAEWQRYVRSSSVEMLVRLDGEIAWRSGLLTP